MLPNAASFLPLDCSRPLIRGIPCRRSGLCATPADRGRKCRLERTGSEISWRGSKMAERGGTLLDSGGRDSCPAGNWPLGCRRKCSRSLLGRLTQGKPAKGIRKPITGTIGKIILHIAADGERAAAGAARATFVAQYGDRHPPSAFDWPARNLGHLCQIGVPIQWISTVDLSQPIAVGMLYSKFFQQ